jgi:hypothetical protein
MTSLSRQGYSIPKNRLTEEQLTGIHDDLTMIPQSPFNHSSTKPKGFPIWKESDKRIYVPKVYGIEKFGLPDKNRLQEGCDICVDFKGELREEQVAPVDAFMDACNDQSKMGGILNLPCAFGKTAIAIYTICKLSKKTLVIVHKEFLMEQWHERISAFAPTARVGLIRGKTMDVDGKDIVIALLQSLSMRDYDESLFQTFGYVIVDEIHRTGAEVFSRALGKVNFRYSLGLSATLDRKDGLSKVFMWHIGNAVYKINSRTDTVHVQMHAFQCDLDSYCRAETLCNGKVNISRMINNVCECKERVDFVARAMKDALDEGPSRKILVLSDRRAHLELIRESVFLQQYSSGFYFGGMKQEDLKKSESCTIILGTFQMSQEGLDIKGLDTLVIASPKSYIIQSCGRILRDKPAERNNIPLIIDIVDDIGVFQGQAKKRRAYYKKCKYLVRI